MNRTLALLKTLLAHRNEVPEIIANVRAIAAGPGWVAHRADPSHNLIDILYPIFDEVDELLTTASSLSARELEAETVTVKNQATALGIDWLELVNVVVPVILQIYELLRALRNKQPIPALAG